MKYCLMPLVLMISLHSRSQTKNSFNYTPADSIVTAITTQYESKFFLHHILMGKNYRETWSTPVKLPVFKLSESGLSIEKLGGGEQTKSLRLKDAEGKDWVLRTVNKTVKDAIPKSLNNTPIENVVQDIISAAHPYGALIVAELAQAAHIVAPQPRIYYVAEDKALGEYNEIFANTVCMLEEREPTPDGSDTDDTEKIQQKISEENDNLILQKKVLKARLLDMLVGDWDRHADQWRWDEIDSNNADYYYAIPRDRDNALFHANGILPALSKLSFMPHLTGFKKKSGGLKNLNRKSYEFDKVFLNEINAEDWQEIVNEFILQMPDEVIEKSVRTLPEPIYELDGEKLISKLKSRRDGLLKNSMKYYRFLSGKVYITGSDERELFVVSGNDDQLIVSVYSLSNNDRQCIYKRTFIPSETRYIELNGLKGDDQFIIEPSARSKIRLRLHGNEGKDSYDLLGKVRSRVHDAREEDNVIVNNSSARIVFR